MIICERGMRIERRTTNISVNYNQRSRPFIMKMDNDYLSGEGSYVIWPPSHAFEKCAYPLEKEKAYATPPGVRAVLCSAYRSRSAPT